MNTMVAGVGRAEAACEAQRIPALTEPSRGIKYVLSNLSPRMSSLGACGTGVSSEVTFQACPCFPGSPAAAPFLLRQRLSLGAAWERKAGEKGGCEEGAFTKIRSLCSSSVR